MDSFEQYLVFQKEVTERLNSKSSSNFKKEVKQNRINVHQKLKSHGTYSMTPENPCMLPKLSNWPRMFMMCGWIEIRLFRPF